MMIGYSKQGGYAITSHRLLDAKELMPALKDSGTTYTSLIINEEHIAYLLLAGVYSYVCYKAFFFLKDMHGYKAKEKKDIQSKQTVKTLSDVGGCSKAKDAILEVIDFIKNPEQFKNMGVRMPKGILLYGPPGTGKTLIAKAAAAEAGIPVIFASGAEFVEIFVGMGAKRIRDLFAQAR